MTSRYTSIRVTAYIPKEYAALLEKWASVENRTISNLAATILQAAIDSKYGTDKTKEDT